LNERHLLCNGGTTMHVSTAIAQILKAEGTEYLFCFPVSSLIEECAKIDLRPIVTRTERTLVNMADSYSRVSNARRIGVTAVQHGPGAENAYAGVAQAYADGSPILFLPGGNLRVRNSLEPNFDAAPCYAGVSQWSAQLNVPERMPDMFRRAFTLLRSGRPAPVVLELPLDVTASDIAGYEYVPPRRTCAAGDPADVREAVRILKSSERPLIHAGQGVLYAEATNELVEFADLIQAPVMTTLQGKSAFPENHPLSIGNGGYSGSALVQHYLSSADVIFGIGCSFTTSVFAAPIPRGKVIVHSTNFARDINKDVPCQHAVLGDAKLVLRQLIDELARQGAPRRNSPVGDIKARKEAWLQQWMPKLTSNERPINPYRVIHELSKVADRSRTIVTHDAGTPRDQIAPFWESLAPRGFIGWGKSSQLGSSLGFALGAKLAAPDKLVVCFMGDTAIGMCGMDLETAVRERIPILVVLVNNGTMGGYERYIPIASEKYRSRYLTGDYLKVADGLGCWVERVAEPGEIAAALKRAIAVTQRSGTSKARPALVEFVTREETDLSKHW
jgi:thiamine pyrophosphate-dependent acetolactate synthase large subunit-like protein